MVCFVLWRMFIVLRMIIIPFNYFGLNSRNIVGFKRLESFQLHLIVEKDERSGGVATGAEASGHRGG